MRKKKGFTLIELLIVIAIIGALATIVVVSLSGNTDDAREKVAQTNLRQIDRLITKMVSIDKVKLKDVCNLNSDDNEASSAEQTNIRRILDSVIVDGTDVVANIKTKGRGYVARTGATLASSVQKTLAGGCISSANGGGSWVIWYTPKGGTTTYCIDSDDGNVRVLTPKRLFFGNFISLGSSKASCAKLD
ncbi:MAG: type II secretion system protein [Candidatus Kaiserbacteria bacterium]|nr:type II secretion system protein [Candidatus Kaiserbacteria bacterium]